MMPMCPGMAIGENINVRYKRVMHLPYISLVMILRLPLLTSDCMFSDKRFHTIIFNGPYRVYITIRCLRMAVLMKDNGDEATGRYGQIVRSLV